MTPSPLRKTSTRYVILKALADHSDGVSSPRLRLLVSKKRAISEDHYVNVVLCQELKKGLVARIGNRECEHCGKVYVIYKITRAGQEALNEVK